MFGEFTRQQQSDSSLDLLTGDGGLSVVVGQTERLGSNALEDVVDKAVHDRHGAAGDTSTVFTCTLFLFHSTCDTRNTSVSAEEKTQRYSYLSHIADRLRKDPAVKSLVDRDIALACIHNFESSDASQRAMIAGHIAHRILNHQMPARGPMVAEHMAHREETQSQYYKTAQSLDQALKSSAHLLSA
ncbi:hypothetical protein HOLleu_35783 [Holothuria leucospilota]|uniref:Uncharacterized protein n=1 Tax=Holothuria leucospilota TaxID=206669 RepID=A0A9Q0YND1_HOLLE|nr:hypothetical protein HOLleu_35783 [Holothuria leucospilota]